MTPLDLLLGAGLTWRATRLVVDDQIADRPRGWLVDRGPGWADELLRCPWCASVYLAAGVYVWWWLHAPSWRVAAAIALWSAVAGWLSTR